MLERDQHESPRWDSRIENLPLGAFDWQIWQLVDSSYPTGSFAHSSGLEAAWQHGEIRQSEDLKRFLEASLHQVGHATLPFVTTAHEFPDRTAEWDQRCDAATTNHVANRASRLQGRAFLASTERIFSIESRALPCGHYAPAFGMTASGLRFPRETAARVFLYGHLRGLVSSAVRLGIVGPMEGQRLQLRLSRYAESLLNACLPLTLEDIAQTSPLIEIWQSAQDRLYSRLFQS